MKFLGELNETISVKALMNSKIINIQILVITKISMFNNLTKYTDKCRVPS